MYNGDKVYEDKEARCEIYVNRIFTKAGRFDTKNIRLIEFKDKIHPASNYYTLFGYSGGGILIFGIYKLTQNGFDGSALLIFALSFILFLMAFPLRERIPVYDLQISIVNPQDQTNGRMEKVMIARCYSRLQAERLVNELKKAQNLSFGRVADWRYDPQS